MQNKYLKFLFFCHFSKGCHVRCHINWVQNFHLMLYLNLHFLFVKYWKNAGPYIIKTLNLSSTRKCDNEPQGTLFSWYGLILFLPHQSNATDHSWPLAMDDICKNKKPCLYVYKKTSAKLSRAFGLSLGKWKCISFIFVFTHSLLQICVTQIQQYLSSV